jgi:hypothetical protein
MAASSPALTVQLRSYVRVPLLLQLFNLFLVAYLIGTVTIMVRGNCSGAGICRQEEKALEAVGDGAR